MSNVPAATAQSSLRPDLQAIAAIVPAGAKVLDLGCGDGALLHFLARSKDVRGRGIELSQDGVIACVRRGLSVRQGHLEEGLADYPTGSFDYVVLSQTLPFLDDPAGILQEMLRVGRKAIVSFPNWGYWRCRVQLLLTGCMPQAPDLPQAWHETPRWQAFSITDFARLTQRMGLAITREVYFAHSRQIRIIKVKNLLATTAVFLLERQNGTQPAWDEAGSALPTAVEGRR